jgi:hypothetical protein
MVRHVRDFLLHLVCRLLEEAVMERLDRRGWVEVRREQDRA